MLAVPWWSGFETSRNLSKGMFLGMASLLRNREEQGLRVAEGQEGL